MTKIRVKLALGLLGFGLVAALPASGQTYSAVPGGDAQYAQCLMYSVTRYKGGENPSPVSGQTKAEAFCTCMWQETPDDFRGNLAKFSETTKGAATNAICEKYANWQ